MAPAIAGPRMYPIPHAVPSTPMPKAWLLSSEISDITALLVETIPEEENGDDGGGLVAMCSWFSDTADCRNPATEKSDLQNHS